MRRLLFVSNLYPDRDEPVRGLDNATLLHHLDAGWEIRVAALRPTLKPTDWFRSPGRMRRRDEDKSIPCQYLPVPYVPKIGSRFNHRLIARRLKKHFAPLWRTWCPDVVLASWLFPDGAGCLGALKTGAAAGFSETPVVLIAQGSDVHRYLEFPARRRAIIETAIDPQVRAIITRSRDLKRRLVEAGCPGDKVHPVYNGVALAFFNPIPQPEARAMLSLPSNGRIFLFIGNLLPVKNPGFLIEAFAHYLKRSPTPSRLVIIGSGPLEGILRKRLRQLQIRSQVVFAGTQPVDRVALFLRAADALCLSSHNEGVPNVVLEALASQRPVAATDVGGISEWIDSPDRGILVSAGDLMGYAEALEKVATGSTDIKKREVQISSRLPDLSWPGAARRYGALLESILSAGSH